MIEGQREGYYDHPKVYYQGFEAEGAVHVFGVQLLMLLLDPYD